MLGKKDNRQPSLTEHNGKVNILISMVSQICSTHFQRVEELKIMYNDLKDTPT